MVFRTLEDVDAWVAAKGPDGAEELRKRLTTGLMSNRRAVLAKAWLERHDRQQAGIAASEAQQQLARQTLAAEVSAAASEDAARWAKWAVVLAAAALIVSAWPYFKILTRWWPL